MSLPLPEKQEPEKWIRELKAAGWTQDHMALWCSPDGGHYRGLYFAWYMMKREQESNA